MAPIIFAVFGMIGGALAVIPVEYITHLILQVPAFTKDQENLSGLLEIINIIIFIGIFESWKMCYRIFYKGKSFRIGIIGAMITSLLVAFSVTSATVLTEIYIAKGVIVRDVAVIGFSAKVHPILLAVIFISGFISIWTTMPNGLREIVKFAEIIEIVEEYE